METKITNKPKKKKLNLFLKRKIIILFNVIYNVHITYKMIEMCRNRINSIANEHQRHRHIKIDGIDSSDSKSFVVK